MSSADELIEKLTLVSFKLFIVVVYWTIDKKVWVESVEVVRLVGIDVVDANIEELDIEVDEVLVIVLVVELLVALLVLVVEVVVILVVVVFVVVVLVVVGMKLALN